MPYLEEEGSKFQNICSWKPLGRKTVVMSKRGKKVKRAKQMLHSISCQNKLKNQKLAL